MRRRSACLALLATMAAAASPGLRLEGGPFLPYRMNPAVAVDDEGVLGTLELQGLRWDGSRVPLFRTRVSARSRSVDLLFYLDEEFRGLELGIAEATPQRSTSVDLAAHDGLAGPEETLLRTRLRELDPPIHLSRAEHAPRRYALLGTDLGTAGFQAAAALFGLQVSRVPLALLGAYVLVAWLLAAFPIAIRGWKRFAGAVAAGVALGTTLAVACLAVPGPMLFRVVFPSGRGSGVLERKVEKRSGYTRVAYGQAGAGTVDLVGVWAPTGIPVADVVPADARVRFSSPPVVTGFGGEGVLLTRDVVTGWVLHAEP